MMQGQIAKFEKLNTMSVNVYCIQIFEGHKQYFQVFPAQITKSEFGRHVN